MLVRSESKFVFTVAALVMMNFLFFSVFFFGCWQILTVVDKSDVLAMSN